MMPQVLNLFLKGDSGFLVGEVKCQSLCLRVEVDEVVQEDLVFGGGGDSFEIDDVSDGLVSVGEGAGYELGAGEGGGAEEAGFGIHG